MAKYWASASRAGGRQNASRRQCRKWRTPVSTMAIPAASAAATISASFTLPPGCAIAVTPARAATSTPSGNGKNASDARTLPRAALPPSRMRSAPRRLATSDPRRRRPSRARARASTIAFDFTCLRRATRTRGYAAPRASAASRATLPRVTSPARGRVAILDDEPAADTLGRERRVCRREPLARRQQPQVLLGRAAISSARPRTRRDDALEERLGEDGRRAPSSTWRLRATIPPKALRVGLARRAVRLGQLPPSRRRRDSCA